MQTNSKGRLCLWKINVLYSHIILFISIKLFRRKIKNGVTLICMPLDRVGVLAIPETFRFNAKKASFHDRCRKCGSWKIIVESHTRATGPSLALKNWIKIKTRKSNGIKLFICNYTYYFSQYHHTYVCGGLFKNILFVLFIFWILV